MATLKKTECMLIVNKTDRNRILVLKYNLKLKSAKEVVKLLLDKFERGN